ncbi:MAG: hypothetical protein EPO51_11990 [Phenylobacterium sp.]|uniref:LPD7 domain-containing protein n=1 Tax=Phenylobacterium sp. TaxID=1871053 RepID=UPI00120682F2|nr:LPD7 domain-containing protein [Phenylobacterium sp.]TAJ71835.1 MAG: hypothetical protein EPO51_11990 [Phenylobacterium sp.]
MADTAINTVESGRPGRPSTAGDVPEAIRRRYLTERSGSDAVAYFVDARVATPAFRDQGRSLSSDRNDPNVVRDLVAIAAHRGWTDVAVRGQTEFRREVWLAARRAGLEVRGHRPSERDRQQLSRATARSPAPDRASGRPDPLQVVEAVVRNRVVEPAEQSRILALARERLAGWLERGAAVPTVRRDRDERPR